MNYYKYLPSNLIDKSWGLTIHNLGYSFIGEDHVYPSKKHPTGYYFSWENGRVLQEYQIIYITEGNGIFESENGGPFEIVEGSIIILYPNERHRYKPNPATGWNEYWIGLSGNFMDNLVFNGFFSISKPVLQIGIKDKMVHLINSVIEAAHAEKPGYQQIISGATIHLLGLIYSESVNSSFEGKTQTSQIMEKACILLRQSMLDQIKAEDIADRLRVSYSWFRHTFKQYTGMAPNQYLIQLKIERSKELLIFERNSVKSVAYELNFESIAYFSKLFKNRVGVTPYKFRQQSFLKFKSE